jgi:hypothetical protein
VGGQSLLTAGVCWCGVVWGVGCEGAQSYSPLRSLADPSKASSAIAQKLLLGWTLLGYRPLVLVCAAALVGRRVPLEAAPAGILACCLPACRGVRTAGCRRSRALLWPVCTRGAGRVDLGPPWRAGGRRLLMGLPVLCRQPEALTVGQAWRGAKAAFALRGKCSNEAQPGTDQALTRLTKA